MMPTSWLYKILGAAVTVAAFLWLVQSRDHWRDKARANAGLFQAERAAHAATVAGYRAAAQQARREDAANLARVEASQAEINERTAYAYENRIASARADAGRLREQAGAAAAHSRAGRTTPVPGLPAAAGRAPQAAGEDRLPQPDKRVGYPEGQLGADDALTATEQAIQLDELVKWVKAQAEVKPDSE